MPTAGRPLTANCQRKNPAVLDGTLLSAKEQEGAAVAKPNYQHEKRQRELAKKQKKEEKLKRKQERASESPEGGEAETSEEEAAEGPVESLPSEVEAGSTKP
jgi:hypothetical protein